MDFQTLKSAADAYQVRFGPDWRAARVRAFTGGVSSLLADVPYDKRRALFDELTSASAEFDARRGR